MSERVKKKKVKKHESGKLYTQQQQQQEQSNTLSTIDFRFCCANIHEKQYEKIHIHVRVLCIRAARCDTLQLVLLCNKNRAFELMCACG